MGTLVSDGLAPICIDEKCGFINRSGKVIIPLTFREAWVFSDGLARAKTDTTEGYINTTGEWGTHAIR